MSPRDLPSRPQRGRYPRVVIVGRDRRYLSEAARHLRGHHFEVATTRRPSEVRDLVRRLGTNVAVVDGSHYIGALGRNLAAIGGAAAPVAVLNVADDTLISPLSRPDLIPKWASLSRLEEYVELAFELRSSGMAESGVALA